MKEYPPKINYSPLGIQSPELRLGLSGILEDMVERYMYDFPKSCHIKPATINRGALTFKLFNRRSRKKKEEDDDDE